MNQRDNECGMDPTWRMQHLHPGGFLLRIGGGQVNTEPESSINASTPVQTTRRQILDWPATRLGWWAVGLAVLFFIMMFINSTVFMRMAENPALNTVVLPLYGIFMLVCGLAAGAVGLFSMIKGHERSILVWFPVIFGLFVLFLLVGELLIPH
jgi:hypothetical protein